MGAGSGSASGSEIGPTSAGLIRVFDTLTPSQRSEAIRILNEYIEGDSSVRDRLVNESRRHYIAKVDLGPLTGNVCPYCGR
jgi:hypothetical protein